MRILTHVDVDVDFPSEAAAQEFDRYFDNFNREFSKFGPFDRVRLNNGRVMLGWQYREYLVDELEQTIEDLGGDPADVDETIQYIPERPPETKQVAPAPKIPEVNADALDKTFAENQAARQKATEESNKKLGEALGGVSG